MSRWGKFPSVACLILLLLGITHLYHLQSRVSGKSESQEEKRSSLIVSDTSIPGVQTDYHSSESSTSETYTTSTSVKSESNLVVFYNRLDQPFFSRLNFPAIKDPKDWLRKYGFHHQAAVQAECIHPKSWSSWSLNCDNFLDFPPDFRLRMRNP